MSETGGGRGDGAGGFHLVGEELRYEGSVISLFESEFEGPGGERFHRDVVRHPGAVSVVPVLDDGQVVLVRQYRAPIDDLLLEIPAGKRDVEGEPPELTAHRELAEEVGYEAAELRLLARFHNSPGFCDEDSWVFLATGLSEVPASAHSVEEQHMTVHRVPLAEIPAMIADGRLRDAKTIIGLSVALLHLGDR